MAKPLYVDIPETRKSAMKPQFKILLKIKHPFIESAELKTNNFAPPTSTSGRGVVIPATGLVIPVDGVIIGADTGTSGGSLSNNGSYKAYPTITITGTVNKPRITNLSTGKFIEFNCLVSDTTTIVIKADGITADSGGTSIFQYLTAASDINNFYVAPGNNNIVMTALSMAADSRMIISWRDTWPL